MVAMVGQARSAARVAQEDKGRTAVAIWCQAAAALAALAALGAAGAEAATLAMVVHCR